MNTNKKKSSPRTIKMASETLRIKSSSKIQKSLAGSVLSQSNNYKETGSNLESLASQVMRSTKYNKTTKTLAGSVLSQSNKKK